MKRRDLIRHLSAYACYLLKEGHRHSRGVRFATAGAVEPLSQVMAPHPGFQGLTASLAGATGLGLRHILIFNGQQLLGRMGPQHLGNFSPWQLAQPAYYQWSGGYLKSQASQPWSTIVLETFPGWRRNCRARLERHSHSDG